MFFPQRWHSEGLRGLRGANTKIKRAITVRIKLIAVPILASLVFPPGALFTDAFRFENGMHLRPGHDAIAKAFSHYAERQHIADRGRCFLCLPEAVTLQQVIKAHYAVSKLHHFSAQAAKQSGIQHQIVAMLIEEVLIDALRVVLACPGIGIGLGFRADIHLARHHICPRLPEHFDIGTVSAPDKLIFRVMAQVLPDMQPAPEVAVHLHSVNSPKFDIGRLGRQLICQHNAVAAAQRTGPFRQHVR